MSTRDQRVGTSHPDIVKEDVSQEYITMSHRYGPRGATKVHVRRMVWFAGVLLKPLLK